MFWVINQVAAMKNPRIHFMASVTNFYFAFFYSFDSGLRFKSKSN